MNYEDYIAANRKVGTFGIKYLDDELGGILRGDLVLIGAASGAGKSTIADIIASHNSKEGKHVTLISLENFDGDNFVQKMYYIYKNISQQWWLTLRNFACGDYDIDTYALQEAEKKAKEYYKNVDIINRQNEGFTKEMLDEEICRAIKIKKSDIVIIDHVDYLDKDEGENEIEHITKTMRMIRDAQYAFKAPVIAISHLRKSSARDVIIPSMDDFIGSSNKVKEATCVIMLAPDYETNMFNTQSSKRATWCCIRKLRMGGIKNQAASLMFNLRKGCYEDNYTLYKVNYNGTKVESI